MKINGIIVLSAFTVVCNIINALETKETLHYNVHDKLSEQAVSYSKTQESLCRYLAFRDIPYLINQYVHGKKALDYGAGTGLSAQFLQQLGLDVIGADSNKEMLQQAMLGFPTIPFYLIKDGLIPYASETFDLVFSSFVLFEIGTENEILHYLAEAKRVMKKDGVCILVTGSQYVYSKDWFIINTDYPENKNLKSGDLAKSYIPDIDMEFIDYYWTEEDYLRLFAQAGLQPTLIHYPLGKESEPYQWKDEKTHSPYVIFVVQAR